MNVPTIIVLAVIALLAAAAMRHLRRQKCAKGNRTQCDSCEAENCGLRDLIKKH